MIDQVKEEVRKLLDKDNSGHGIDHIRRVYNLSLKFAEKTNADVMILSLISLLHDIDDYKLFESGDNLKNAKRVLNMCGVSDDIKSIVCDEIEKIGFNKRMAGKSPNTIEGKIVSDADMCDTLGASGIIRIHSYGKEHGRVFFDKDIFPNLNMTASEYKKSVGTTTICHMFEKILKLKGLMLTEPGKKEAQKRNQVIVDFLYNFFEEENAPEWKEYLDNYLEKQKGLKL